MIECLAESKLQVDVVTERFLKCSDIRFFNMAYFARQRNFLLVPINEVSLIERKLGQLLTCFNAVAVRFVEFLLITFNGLRV